MKTATTKLAKTTMSNDFHGSTAVVQGTLTVDMNGDPAVRISQRSYDRACRKLCGIKTCKCGNHQTHAEPCSNPSDDGGCDWIVRKV